MELLQAFKNSLNFITIIPAGKWDEKVSWSKALALFPAVGLLIGLILALEKLAITKIAPVVCTATWIAITGAFHLDGLADTFDAMASGRSRDERLNIMKDSHVGTFGTVAVATVIASKLWLTHQVNICGLITAPVLGRLALLEVSRLTPAAKPQGLGKLVRDNLNNQALITAHATSILICVLCGLQGMLLYITANITSRLLSRLFLKLFGGITGDTLGAACELTETVVLAVATLLAGP